MKCALDTTVSQAISDGSLEDIRALFTANPSLITKPLYPSPPSENAVQFNKYPIHLAAEIGRADVVELLIELGADPKTPTGLFGTTPLDAAIGGDHVEVVRLLLRHDVCPTRKPAIGPTSLEFARQRGNEEIIQLLTARLEPNENGVECSLNSEEE